MRDRTGRAAIFAGLLLAGAGVCMGGEGGALAVKAGTLGGGLDFATVVAPNVSARLGFGLGSVSRDETSGDVDYAMKLKAKTMSVLLDFYPTGHAFHLTGGVLYNGTRLEGQGKLAPAATYDIGGVTYTGAQLGRLDGKVTFNRTVPYLGVGWSNLLRRSSGLYLSLDVGAYYQGKPKVQLDSSNAAAVPGLDERLRTEEERVADDLDSYRFYPVISLAVGFQL